MAMILEYVIKKYHNINKTKKDCKFDKYSKTIHDTTCHIPSNFQNYQKWFCGLVGYGICFTRR